MTLEKTLESLLDSKEIKPVNPQGNQPWIFTGRTNAIVEAPTLCPPGAKSRLIGKDQCWERLRKGGEGGDRGWNGCMASPTQWTWVWGNSGKYEGQESLVCYSPWGHKESDTNQQLNNNNNLNTKKITCTETVTAILCVILKTSSKLNNRREVKEIIMNYVSN